MRSQSQFRNDKIIMKIQSVNLVDLNAELFFSKLVKFLGHPVKDTVANLHDCDLDDII